MSTTFIIVWPLEFESNTNKFQTNLKKSNFIWTIGNNSTFLSRLIWYWIPDPVGHTSVKIIPFFWWTESKQSLDTLLLPLQKVAFCDEKILKIVAVAKQKTTVCEESRCQSRQHFSRAFFVQIFGTKPNVTRENDVRTKNLYV